MRARWGRRACATAALAAVLAWAPDIFAQDKPIYVVDTDPECQSTAASCEAQCFDTGLRAFTCTPVVLDGCSASCSCK